MIWCDSILHFQKVCFEITEWVSIWNYVDFVGVYDDNDDVLIQS